MALYLISDIKTILARLTQPRADKIDNLDAAVTSRAPADKALSTDIWTAGHASKINTNLDKKISSISNAPVSSGGFIGVNTGSLVLVDAINVTGFKGMLACLSFRLDTHLRYTVEIDGVDLFGGEVSYLGFNDDHALPALINIPFENSLRIRIRTAISQTNSRAYIHWYKRV